MAWKYTRNRLPEVKANLAEGMAAVVRVTASDILERADEAVPSPEHPGPYATGALRASGHVVTDEYSGYEEAIAAAKAAPGTRIVKQDQILPPTELPPLPAWRFMALVVYPLTYAGLIENGFFHTTKTAGIVGTEKYPMHRGGYVREQPYLVPAFVSAREAFEERMRRVMSSLDGSTVIIERPETPEETASREAWQRGELGLAKSAVHQYRLFAREEMHSRMEARAFEPQAYRGYRETKAEASERARNDYETMRGYDE